MWDTVWPYGEVRSSLNAANSHRAHLTMPPCGGSCDLQYVVPYKDCVFFPTEPGGQTRRRANPLETHKGARFTSRAARSCHRLLPSEGTTSCQTTGSPPC